MQAAMGLRSEGQEVVALLRGDEREPVSVDAGGDGARGVDDVESVRVPYSTVNEREGARDAKASVEPRACGSVRAA